jgi:chloramphenicol 3-O phosphotransferase
MGNARNTESYSERVKPSRIIFVNGTSSSGKTTIARELQKRIPEPFCYYASDQLADQGFRSRKEFTRAPSERERFFDGFHRSIAAFSEAGNDLIIEHIVEEQSWADDLVRLLSPFDVFWVGVHAPVEELDRREEARGNRRPGEARFHLKTHRYVRYDVEVDSTQLLDSVLERIILAWRARTRANIS